jgi:threonylcarbamoyladenosine tRNA methylthiotransferase MtaB
MKRRYNANQAMRAMELLRERIPDVQFTTDVIVGFPQETDEDFRETYDFLDRAGFLMAHIFTYSKREGTVAAEMSGQIPENIKTERLHTLEALVAKRRGEILSRMAQSGQIRRVLFEMEKDGVLYGHTAEFIEVAVAGESSMRGEFADVRIVSSDNDICFGELI